MKSLFQNLKKLQKCNIVFSKGFEKDFYKLPRKIQEKFFYDIIPLFRKDKHDKRLKNHALKGELYGHRLINVTGDVRVIYKVIDNDTFVMIGMHSYLYG